MINSLPENSLLKNYLLVNCIKLLLPLTESTGISVNGNLPSIKLLHDLKEPNDLILAFKNFYKDFSGVYIFIHKQTKKIYIGSAINFENRFKAHQINSIRPKRGGNNNFYSFVKNNGGWSAFNWGVIIKTPNHILEYLKLNPALKLNTNDQITILTSFTQFEA